jgi:hypothetical protein
MKKLLSLLLAILMLTTVALVACTDEPDTTKESDDLAFNETEPPATDAPATDAPVSEAPSQGYTFADVEEKVYVQNCSKVNIRTSPSAANDSNIAGSIDFGDGKSYTRVKFNDNWSGIKVGEEIFYVNTYFLTTSPAEVVFTTLESPKTLYVNNVDADGNKGSLYLRSFTSTNPDPDFYPNGNVAAVAKHGAPLKATALSTDENWYRVEFSFEEKGATKTVTGYVWNGKYVSETVPTGEPTTNVTPSEPAVG